MLSYQWARTHMKILDETIQQLKTRGKKGQKPLAGITLSFSLQLTPETAVLLMGIKELGGTVVASSGNVLTTHDDIAAFLDSQGIAVFGWHDQTLEEFSWCIGQALEAKPQIITDDGGHLNVLAHTDPKFSRLSILGGTEETGTGITRMRALQKVSGKLRYPIIAVNNAHTKYLFDNRYGTGQSTIQGYLCATNLLFATRLVVVAGYGWVGKGVASKCKAMGSRVIVTEVDPIKALEAHLDGFEVMPMSRAARIGDIFVTCTGMINVITREHLESMKSGAIVGNVGHFDVEIDTDFLFRESKKFVRRARPNLDLCTLPNSNKKIFLVSDGRVANLIAARGHPPEVMAQSFSNQLLSILYVVKNHQVLPHKIINVPLDIDVQIARNALRVSGIRIDAES